MKISHRGAISLTGTTTTTRIRVPGLEAGTKLIPLLPAQPVLGYWHQGEKITAYVAGTMPPHLRTAAEEGRTSEEQWFGPLPIGIAEIDLSECRYEYLVQQPVKVLPLFAQPVSTHQAA